MCAIDNFNGEKYKNLYTFALKGASLPRFSAKNTDAGFENLLIQRRYQNIDSIFRY